MSFKFGLNKKKIPVVVTTGRKKPLLGDDDDDDDDNQAPSKAKAANAAQEIGGLTFEDSLAPATQTVKATAPKPKKGEPPAPPTRKAKAKPDDPTTIGFSASAREAEQRAQEALEGDATLYDYDAAYDALHAQSAAKAAAEREDAASGKPKYMDSLFQSAEQRKKDQLRARDKLLQREREAEGDEFADKEKFVTGAYKEQQEEARRAEAEEKLRHEAEEEQKRKFGMQGFHKQMLMEQERRHQEVVDAAAQALKEGVKAPVAADEDQEKDKTESELAAELQKQGKTVILTEDGQVADKRQLLKAGLNIIAKPPSKSAKSQTPSSSSSSSRPNESQSQSHGGTAKISRNAQRERQTHMVAAQIEAANKRKADEDAAEQAKLLHASKSQKSSADISSAKERYLQRKREAAEAKAAGSGQ